MRVVLDTNVLVSALMKPRGIEALVLLLAFQERFELCISTAVLAEYERVLPRPELKLNPHEIQAALANIRKLARLVHSARTLKISPHESDNRFYECADAAEADYIVTGNKKHFPVGRGSTKIVAARQFLETIQAQPGE
jgi:uncharacterized protein